ncbi:hypothetical protein BKA66DRAFT_565887 [Pyrenochaeta sp. MPI-SDFR-AT-0127]|nr:hypothetical protein BKA66DRAFT_565887 [Pyrenochaeta sp. MPI-SDFR-AT-0127]
MCHFAAFYYASCGCRPQYSISDGGDIIEKSWTNRLHIDAEAVPYKRCLQYKLFLLTYGKSKTAEDFQCRSLVVKRIQFTEKPCFRCFHKGITDSKTGREHTTQTLDLSFTREVEETWLRVCGSYGKSTFKIIETIRQRTTKRLSSLRRIVEAENNEKISRNAEDTERNDSIWKAHLAQAAQKYPSMKTLLRKEMCRVDSKRKHVETAPAKRTEQEKEQRLERVRERLAQLNQPRARTMAITNAQQPITQEEPRASPIEECFGGGLSVQQPIDMSPSATTRDQHPEPIIPEGMVRPVVRLPLVAAAERRRRSPVRERYSRSYGYNPRTEERPSSPDAFFYASAAEACPTCGQHMPKAIKLHTVSDSLEADTASLMPAQLRPEAVAFKPAQQQP